MQKPPKLTRRKILTIILALVCLALLISWLWYTPPGLLGKANAAGFAVCHQFPTHSFELGDLQFPLCARCSGMHLGVFFGLLYHLQYKRKSGLPSKKVLIVFGVFLLLFGLDGINSYMRLDEELGMQTILPFDLSLGYETQNWTRLITGTLLGLAVSGVIYPVFNQSIWKYSNPSPVLHSWRQIGSILLIAAVIIGLTLTGSLIVLYPFAFISTLDIFLILTLIYTILWIMIFRKENTFTEMNELLLPFLAGFGTTILQIGLMNLGRYILTGSWAIMI